MATASQSPLLGCLVSSRAGRDRDRHYLVVGESPDGMLYLSDGQIRTVSRPKRKNLKHVVVHGPASGLPQGRAGTGGLTDLEVRKALQELLSMEAGEVEEAVMRGKEGGKTYGE